MQVEIFVLCDAATDYQGKLNVLGTFDTIWASNAQFVYSQFAIALRLRFSRIEEGDHKIKITVVDEDGKAVLPPIDAGLFVKPLVDGTPSTAANLVLNAHAPKIEQFGEHSIDLAVDGRQVASLPLFIRKAEMAQNQKN